MAENSKIEWTDHTFNPWVGCQKISPACDHCYAEAWAKRSGLVQWGPHSERRRTSDANWRKPLAWNKAAKIAGKRHRVFCASLADWLDNQVSDAWRDDLANLIEATPYLDWLLLTKRIGNFDKHAPWHDDDIPSNVWIGITCGSQDEYNRDWPKMRHLRAVVRFVSYEPALGPLRIEGADVPDWIICGGESGPAARMMDPEWARELKRWCEVHGIAFFMKQMTGKKPIPDDLLVRQFPRVAPATPDHHSRGNVSQVNQWLSKADHPEGADGPQHSQRDLEQ